MERSVRSAGQDGSPVRIISSILPVTRTRRDADVRRRSTRNCIVDHMQTRDSVRGARRHDHARACMITQKLKVIRVYMYVVPHISQMASNVNTRVLCCADVCQSMDPPAHNGGCREVSVGHTHVRGRRNGRQGPWPACPCRRSSGCAGYTCDPRRHHHPQHRYTAVSTSKTPNEN